VIRSNSPLLADYLSRIDALAPIVAAHRELFDRERRLPKPVFDAIAEGELLRLWLPATLGGPELSPLDFVAVVEAASAVDASVGWIVGNGGGMSRAAGYLPPDVAKEWFADNAAFVVAATGALGSATKVDGGYRVSGRWPFASGIHFASRMMGLCAVESADTSTAKELICCYFDPSVATVHDTWRVSGLRGTGSCDFDVADVFVPMAHAHPFVDMTPSQPGLIYRMPHVSVFALSVSVVPLGIARAAITNFVEMSEKARPGSSSSLRDREVIQAEVGRAETTLRAARSLMAHSIDELLAAMDARSGLVPARANFRAACSFAADTSVRIVEAMAAAAGAVTIFEASPLERCVRDVHAAAKHIAMSPNNYILAGRIRLGLDAGVARF
jgi:alkylation response protein AidB-like acyl-CoA dehydrogenase